MVGEKNNPQGAATIDSGATEPTNEAGTGAGTTEPGVTPHVEVIEREGPPFDPTRPGCFRVKFPSLGALTEKEREMAFPESGAPRGWPVRLDCLTVDDLQRLLGSADAASSAQRSSGDAGSPAANDIVVLPDLLVIQFLEAVIRVAHQRPGLLKGLMALLPESYTVVDGKRGMTKKAFAERWSYSERYIEYRIQEGLPTRGKGKAVRIVLPEADEWMLQDDEPPEEDEIELEARMQARSGKGRSQ